jgi:hypothetical protein
MVDRFGAGASRVPARSTSNYSTAVTTSEHVTGYTKRSVTSRSSPGSTNNWSKRTF